MCHAVHVVCHVGVLCVPVDSAALKLPCVAQDGPTCSEERPTLPSYLALQKNNFFLPPPIPLHVLMNFRAFPPGCGDSVADF